MYCRYFFNYLNVSTFVPVDTFTLSFCFDFSTTHQINKCWWNEWVRKGVFRGGGGGGRGYLNSMDLGGAHKIFVLKCMWLSRSDKANRTTLPPAYSRASLWACRLHRMHHLVAVACYFIFYSTGWWPLFCFVASSLARQSMGMPRLIFGVNLF